MRAGSLRDLASFYAAAESTLRPSGQRPTVYENAPYVTMPVEVVATSAGESDIGNGKRSWTNYTLKGRTPERVPVQTDKVVLGDGTEMFVNGVLDFGRECQITCRVEA